MTTTNHKWGAPIRYEPHESPNGCAQTERTCDKCGLVRITVHPPQGLPWLEWRTRDPGHGQMQLSRTPPCVVPVAAKPPPSSVDNDSLSLRAPAVKRDCTHESRNPQGATRR